MAGRRLNIKPPRLKKGPTIQMIESHPKARKRELMLSGGGKRFRALKQTGNRTSIMLLSGRYPKGFFFVHTHIPTEKHQTVSALPSVDDVCTLSDMLRAGRNRAGAIFSLDWNGKAKGYVIYKIGKPIDYEDSLELRKYVRKRTRIYTRNKKIRYVPQFYKRYFEALRDFLEEQGYKFEHIIAPMRGFVFDETLCAFVKARKRM